jgi:hypothetical protein
MTTRSLVAAALAATAFVRAEAQTTTTIPSIPITFSGEIRQRSDWDRPDGATSDLASYLRTRLGLSISPAANTRLFVQLQDSRVLGAEANTTSTAPDVFDLHQGYLELTGGSRVHVTARAGRQEMVFGNERLVGAANWTQNGRSFDGVSVSAAPAAGDRWSTALFAATLEENGRRFAPATSTTTPTRSPDHLTVGAFAQRALGRANLDATLLMDRGGHFRTFVGSDRTTIDARIRVPDLAWLRWELEGAYQTGRQNFVPASGDAAKQTVGAWFAGARVGTRTSPSSKAGVTAGVDILSGDRTATDGTYGAFNTMYATNHPFYGLMDLFLDPAAKTRDAGLVDVLATGSLKISNAVTARAEAHRFTRQVNADGTVGWEGDVVLPYRVNQTASIEAGASVFRAGHDALALGLGSSGQRHDWLYLQLRVGF